MCNAHGPAKHGPLCGGITVGDIQYLALGDTALSLELLPVERSQPLAQLGPTFARRIKERFVGGPQLVDALGDAGQ